MHSRRASGIVGRIGAAGAFAASAVAITLVAAWVPAQAAPQMAIYPNLVIPALARDVGIGPTDPASSITLGIAVTHPDTAGEDRYLRDEYTPGTSGYHRFLTPAQWQARFGVSPQRLDSVVAWLRADGMTATTIAGVDDYVLASGTTAQASHLVNVSFRDHRIAGRVAYANTTAPTVPASLGVFTIVGLNNLEGPRLNHGGEVVGSPKPSGPRPALVGPNSNLGLSTPQDLWDIYEQPATNRGSGQQMAIFGWGVTDGTEKDLRTQEHEFGLPATPISIAHYGTEPITDATGGGEWRLDTQSSSGMAPDLAALKLYFGNAGSDADLVAAFKAWNMDPNGPLQGSASFGGCEETPVTDSLGGGPGNPGGLLAIANANQDLYQATFKQTVVQGRTLFNSSGDTGSSCPVVTVGVNGVANELVPLVQFPCASPYVVCVGGTVLYYDNGSNGDSSGTPRTTPATRAQETPWTFTGGGTSFFLQAPTFQSGITQLTGQCATDQHGAPYTPPVLCRGIPDVAAQSGDGITGPGLGGLNPVTSNNGFAITVNGATDQSGGGTSLSSPLWAGMWARVQAASAAGTGFADPLIYAIGKDATKYANDFYDISPTNNGGAGSNGLYASLPGWDYVSGWGTPRLTNLMKDIDGGNTTPLHPQPAAAVPTVPLNFSPCMPLFTGTKGSDNYLGIATTTFQGQNPQLNILAGAISTSADGKSITTALVINNLTTTLPPGGQGNLYYMIWGYKSTQYFTEVSVDATGAIAYHDGTISGNQFSTDTTGTPDKGTFVTGPNGLVTVTVGTANVGSPPKGGVLTAPNGATKELVGAAGAGLLSAVDGAGPKFDFQLGQACPNAIGGAPGTPGAVLTPILNGTFGTPNTTGIEPAGVAGPALLLAGGGWMVAIRARRRHRR